jgi:hypothetical protein
MAHPGGSGFERRDCGAQKPSHRRRYVVELAPTQAEARWKYFRINLPKKLFLPFRYR